MHSMVYAISNNNIITACSHLLFYMHLKLDKQKQNIPGLDIALQIIGVWYNVH